MSFNTILTYLPGPEKAQGLLNAAVQVAIKHDAHLICLHVIPELEFYQPMGMYYDGSIIDAHRKALQIEADEIEKVVKKWSESNNAKIEWRCLKATNARAIDYIIDQSMLVDLVIAEQRMPVDMIGSKANLPVQIVLNASRPVLTIPNGYSFDGFAEHALVAWDLGKSASRAVFDSIPLLRNAKNVTLYSVASDKPTDGMTPEQYMALALNRHGIDAEMVIEQKNEKSVGELVLDQAARLNSDLLVIGCYGHSRYREIVFGGVTRHVLQNAKIPLLLSH